MLLLLLCIGSECLHSTLFSFTSNYFTCLLSTVARRFVSVFTSSACLDKIASIRAKVSCTGLISACSCVLLAVIVDVSVLFLVA